MYRRANIEYTSLRELLPNKVAQWISGKSILSLVNCLRSTKSNKINLEKLEQKLTFDTMQEQCNEQGSLLWVCYETQQEHKWYWYNRGKDGGIGFEGRRKDHSKRCIIYSEYFKTLKSPHLDKPLPSQVLDYLLQHASLASMVTSIPAASRTETQASVQIHIKHEDEQSICWSYNRRTFTCSSELVPRGVVLVECETNAHNNDYNKTYLFYSERFKSWLSPALTEAHREDTQMPLEVVEWIKRHQERQAKKMEQLYFIRAQQLQQPWCTTPVSLRKLKQTTLLVLVAAIEGRLNYGFKNPMRLVEALTHASYAEALTPCCQCLAFVGAPLVEMLLIEQVIEIAHKAGFRLRQQGIKSMQQQQDDICAGMFKHVPITKASTLLDWASVACNHITYSYAACKLDLHKFILISSKELAMGIQSFERFVDQAEKNEPSKLWLKMLCHDAPRVLSDVFQALVAAVFLDSNLITVRQTFKGILKEHILTKLFIPELINHDGGPLVFGDAAGCASSEGTLFEINNYAKMSNYVSIRRAVTDACVNNVISPGLLGPGASVNKKNEVLDGSYIEHMKLLHDLHCCQCSKQDKDFGLPVCSTSPRTAKMRCKAVRDMTSETMAKIMTCTSNFEKDNSEEDIKTMAKIMTCTSNFEKDNSEEDIKTNEKLKGQNTRGQSVWCKYCEMELNGPIQYNEHKIGKKHKRKIQGAMFQKILRPYASKE